MKRVYVGVLVLVVGIGVYVSMGATAQTHPKDPRNMTGKVVVFNHEGWSETTSDSVRFHTVGGSDFLVFGRPKTDTLQYDCWLPLNKITSIYVFDTMDDAIARRKPNITSKQQSETTPK